MARTKGNGDAEGKPGAREWFDSLELSPDSKIAIVTHDTPDPDAIGAAMCLVWVFRKKFQVEAHIFHNGSVSHPQTKTMVNLLNVGMKRLPTLVEDEKEYALKIAVDSTPGTWSRARDHEIGFDAYFDHHPKAHVPKSWKGYADYRNTGSCCAQMWQIMGEIGLSFDEADEEDHLVATAMMVGIRTDTEEMSTEDTTETDLSAVTALHSFVVQKALRNIIKYPIPKYYFELRKLAESNAEERDNILVVGLEFLASESRDALAWLADDLTRRDSIDTCVAYGLIDDQLVGVVRCTNPSYELNEFISRVFGEGTGGGKRGKAAASAPLGPFFRYTDNTKDVVWAAVSKIVVDRVFLFVGGH